MRKAFLTAALTLLGLVTITRAYRIASVNDIHADLKYDPHTKGTCISKTPDALSQVGTQLSDYQLLIYYVFD